MQAHAFVLVLVRVEQREWGGFTYASKDAREHDDRLLLTRCPEIRHHRRVETRGDLRRHFETARPGLSTAALVAFLEALPKTATHAIRRSMTPQHHMHRAFTAAAASPAGADGPAITGAALTQ